VRTRADNISDQYETADRRVLPVSAWAARLPEQILRAVFRGKIMTRGLGGGVQVILPQECVLVGGLAQRGEPTIQLTPSLRVASLVP
jgi:hypothetical protein